MRETFATTELRERDREKQFHITVIGDACSGKSTLLRSLQDQGFTVHAEPDNPLFELYLDNPKKFAFQNQLHKMTQLMQLELTDTAEKKLSYPHFRESGVLATAIYNKYHHDKGLTTDEEFNHLQWLYNYHMNKFSDTDLVVYLYADEDTIKDRAIKRDGLVAHDPRELEPYWQELLTDLHERGIPVFRINTGMYHVNKTREMILTEVERMSKEQSLDTLRGQRVLQAVP